MVSLCDTPGFMVGPEAERTGLVRHVSRMFVTGASLTVPFCTIVLRKGYGLGAQAMAGGSFRSPLFIVAWPSGELGGMGLEGAVRLGFRRELEAVEDPVEREALFASMVDLAYEHGKALNVATAYEIDDVIDPAESRTRIVEALRASPPAAGPDGQEAQLHRHLVTGAPVAGVPPDRRVGAVGSVVGRSAVDDHRAAGVGHAVLADRAEHEAGERAVAPAGHHQEGGVAGRLDQHLTGRPSTTWAWTAESGVLGGEALDDRVEHGLGVGRPGRSRSAAGSRCPSWSGTPRRSPARAVRRCAPAWAAAHSTAAVAASEPSNPTTTASVGWSWSSCHGVPPDGVARECASGGSERSGPGSWGRAPDGLTTGRPVASCAVAPQGGVPPGERRWPRTRNPGPPLVGASSAPGPGAPTRRPSAAATEDRRASTS